MTPEDPRPYRRNVGIAVFNAAGSVFAGRAISSGPEVVLPGYEWQMPQGGIDREEDIVAAARRELFEETSIRSVSFLGATDEWWTYDFPPYSGPPHRLTAFRGQSQRWVAFRFEGEDTEIEIEHLAGGEPAEFLEWAWLELGDMLSGCARAGNNIRRLYFKH